MWPPPARVDVSGVTRTNGVDFKNANPKTKPILKTKIMSTSAILLIILIVLLIGALPAWPYSNGWGYYPSGGLGLVVLILLILLLTGRL